MSIAEVQARISDIQSKFASLASAQGLSVPYNGALISSGATTLDAAGRTFASNLQGALDSQGAQTVSTVINAASKAVGMPYVWGGSTPADGGMDCSGLVQYAYAQAGIDLPRVSADQARSGEPVASLAEAQPGDLIAWDNSSRNVGADHIAIYIGDGKMIEAPRTGLDIRVISIEEAGHGTPDYIRRVLPSSGTTATTSGGWGNGGTVAATGAPALTGASAGSFTGSTVAGVPYAQLFNAAGAKYGVDPVLLASIARQESGYNPKAVSPAGAQGLMQLMPATARGLGVTNSFDPAQAVAGAAKLMRQLLDRFDRVDLALAGYNAGPGAVDKYHGIPPYAETQNYVRSIMSMLKGA